MSALKFPGAVEKGQCDRRSALVRWRQRSGRPRHPRSNRTHCLGRQRSTRLFTPFGGRVTKITSEQAGASKRARPRRDCVA